jgi:hypothetical protein
MHEPGPHKSSYFVRARIAHEMTPSARQPGRKPRLTCTFGVDLGSHNTNRLPFVAGPLLSLE